MALKYLGNDSTVAAMVRKYNGLLRAEAKALRAWLKAGGSNGAPEKLTRAMHATDSAATRAYEKLMEWTRATRSGTATKGLTMAKKRKKRRSAAQRAATAKLVALNKRRHGKKKRKSSKRPSSKRGAAPKKKRRTAAQRAATRKLVALNKRRAAAAKRPRRSRAQKRGDRKRSLKMIHRPYRSKEAASEQGAAIMAALGNRFARFNDAESREEQGAAIAAALAGAARHAPKSSVRRFRRAAVGAKQLGLPGMNLRTVRGGAAIGHNRLMGLIKAESRLRAKAKKRKKNPAWRPGRPKKGKAWWMCEVYTPKAKRPVIYIEKATQAEATHGAQALAARHAKGSKVVLSGPYKWYPQRAA